MSLNTHYPQQQHHALHASTDKRKHLNLLLFDQLEEINRIYKDRKPSYTLTRTACRAQSEAQQGDGREAFMGMFLAQKTMPSEFGATTQALSQAALQSMNQTYQVDAPSASYPHSYAPESSVHEDEPTEHTVQQPSPAPQTRPAQNTAGSLTATGTAKPPSWLMPHQTGDREAGRKMAELIRKKRTPTGAFANLDLAKAAK